jgi:hypothetical protein
MGIDFNICEIFDIAKELEKNRAVFYPGLAAAAGIELGHGKLRWLPEFRYTRWTANIAGPSGPLRFNPNQAEFLLGLRL